MASGPITSQEIDGETLETVSDFIFYFLFYSQQKQDWELTVAQIMISLLPNSDLKKVGKTTGPSSMT